ncbi:hypothetical protein BV394_09290 [Brevirhabdus pacifica]|uniref:Uncharacterized protein n=1 Tax=Brevirhabdus pacifica TaxID=1267768 RepID=A0A1U7DIY3_9RHOB|nr:LPS export ABC transporter periplasmic protein LptC [Brevirhabdus pacifica]APX89885.1 hypothetical protein BV394_09290 [Brevirhabdus pacifica]OWU74386.1 hypothetical protein ATO5_14335 [Loktanella sp. 22II-4b]PJJ82892.1 lipopolysaccharide export system protein LptC [Brevirhabdus pacifica]
MLRADNRYSRFVALAKIILPLAALGLLSTLVLFSRSVDHESAIPYAEVDVHELARGQGIGEPTYSTVMGDGSAITVRAATARPNLAKPSQATASGLSARLTAPDGTVVDMSAREGAIDTDTSTVDLRRDVTIVTSTGYTITTDALATRMDRTQVVSPGRIVADGPMGHLEAGRMELTDGSGMAAAGDNGGEAQGGYVLLFQGGVKLVYKPE